ncbi:phospholipase A2-alpha [Tanacetum coccineum]
MIENPFPLPLPTEKEERSEERWRQKSEGVVGGDGGEVVVMGRRQAVHVGGDTGLTLAKECSNKCESSFCKVPPLLRYGKYCGILYSGCPGEKPCDELDACCMKHDACISANNSEYLVK